MSRKTNLPDSLELLLDTMCNTFGGIMFIAISLIIISQLVSKLQQSMTVEDLNESKLKKMQQNNDAIYQEISELQKLIFAAQRQSLNVSPGIKEFVLQYTQAREENLHMQGKQDNLEAKIAAELERINRLKTEIAQSEVELKAKKAFFAQRQKQLADKKQELLKNISELEEVLRDTQPRTLRFAREEETSLEPYWVLLKNNKLYRFGSEQFPLSGEVALQTFNFGRSARMLPQNGTSLSDNPTVELEYLFKNVSKDRYFISLLIDYESFNTLLAARQYLRNCKFMVKWSVNPNFEFNYSDNVRHTASQ